MKKLVASLIGLCLMLLCPLASATMVNSFEANSYENPDTLPANGLILTQGIPSRAVVQMRATSSPDTLYPTDGRQLLKMVAGTDDDVINPLFPKELVTVVTFKSPVVIDQQYLLIDYAFMNRDVHPYNDRLKIGFNGLLYDITGSAETGWHAPFTLGWKTAVFSFSRLGTVDLSFGCMNHISNGGSSYCIIDNVRTANVVPTIIDNHGIPIVTGFPEIKVLPAIPEPKTYALLLAGIGLIGVIARRHRPPS